MTVRSALRVVGWNVFLLLVVVAAAEAVFGGWLHGGDLGTLHVPRDVLLRHAVGDAQPGGSVAVYRRDHWGFRGSHVDPAEIDILAVGGSTTNELYHDEREVWTAVLQRRFADAGRRVVVANAGVDGHSTVGHLRSLEVWFPRVPGLRPKLILFYVGINDVHVRNHDRFDAIVSPDGWGRFRRYVSNNSAIANTARTVQGMIRADRARVVYRNEPPKLVPVTDAIAAPPPDEAALAAYADRVRALAAGAQRLGARAVFVTQRRGDAFVLDGRLAATGPSAVVAAAVQAQFNAAAMAACHTAGALCIDLAGDIGLTPADFVDAIHTNPEGSRKIGDYLYRTLKDAL